MKRLVLVLVFTLCGLFASINAQDTEFWFSPMFAVSPTSYLYNNHGGFMISNPSNQDAEVVIYYFADDTSDTIKVDALGFYHRKYTENEIQIQKKLEWPNSLGGSVTNGGVRITSNVPIFVSYLFDHSPFPETVMLKGKSALGTSFHIAHAEGERHHQIPPDALVMGDPYISIIGTEDNTTVTLNLKAAADGYPVGTSNVTINKGQVFIAHASVNTSALKGSVITSDKPISVIAGELMCTTFTLDHCADQVLRDDYAGTCFVFTLSAGFDDYIRPDFRQMVCNYLDIIALENDTKIYINWGSGDELLATLNAGQTFQSDTFSVARQNACATIHSTKPIHCQQISGREASVCHLSNFYQTSTNHLSFFSYAEEDIGGHAPVWIGPTYPAVMLAYMQSGKNDFTISYPGQSETSLFNWITANSVHIDSEGDVPAFNGWKYIRFTLPANARNQIITVNNSSSVFQLGFTSALAAGTTLNYFSSYARNFQFEHDTVFKCVGTSYTLIGGIADNYEWTLPNGTTQNGPTMSSLSATQEGRYILKMQQGSVSVSDTCWVKDIYFKASLATAHYVVGAPYSPSFNLNPELVGTSSIFFEYDWTFGGGATPATATGANPSVSWPTGGPKNISLKLTVKSTTQTSVNCDTTINVTIKEFMPNLPDNIIEADCYGTPPSSVFSIKQLAVSNAADIVYSVATPLCGDIDNDGKVEIVVCGGIYPGTPYYTSKVVQIFEMNGDNLILQQSLNTPGMAGILAAPLSIANVDGGNYAAIFICTKTGGNAAVTDQRQLIKYTTTDGVTYSEAARVSYSSIATKDGGIPMVADFNGDGIPEVVVYDKVFNARTLTLIADGGLLSNASMGFGQGAFDVIGNTSQHGTYMAVADMDNDGKPEVIGGNCAYKVNITNPNGTAGNSFTLWSKCDGTGPNGEAHGDVADGCTAVADFDGDGFLDVAVTVTGGKNTLSNLGSVYIWNPRTKKVLHTSIINNIPVANLNNGPSVPFIGDIDNDGEPEICLTAQLTMRSYDYDKTTKTLTQKWAKATSDNSACTTMSMFDFNQDGYTELVYRDETHVRILNGVTGDNIQTFPVTSGTGNENPIVADVNGDGSAEIIVTGCTSGYVSGRLWIYSSNPAGNWAPARKVWNQFAYNAVNINEDLTVPKVMFKPATEFTGGSCGTVRPYNGYLMQQTMLSADGCPIFLLPDVTPIGGTYTLGGTMANISVTLENKGDAAIGPPVWFTLYKNNISAANKIKVDSANISILPGDTATVSFLADLTGVTYTNLIVQLNDSAGIYPYQQECDDQNNSITITKRDDVPDNIIDADCFGTPPAGNFRFKELARSSTTTTVKICDFSQAIAGDIDNDGNIEIIIANKSTLSEVSGWSTNQLHIFEYKNNALSLQQTINTPYYDNPASPYSIAKVDGNDYAAIFLCTRNSGNTNVSDKGQLIKYKYDIVQGKYVEDARATYTSISNKEVAQPMVVDFNGDGIPEVSVYDKVFNARTLTLLADGNYLTAQPVHGFGEGAYYNQASYSWTEHEGGSIMAVADMDGDGVPEVIGGHSVYKVNITNPNGTSGNSFALWSECDHTDLDGLVHNESYDGATSIADVDNDGFLDIVVSVTSQNNLSSSNGALYVWNPRTKKVMNKNIINNIPTWAIYPANGPSVSFIGDIDNDNYPELCLTAYLKMYAFEYDIINDKLIEKWAVTTTDASSATTMSLFDFNQDGSNELIYRDQNNLRIINGNTGANIQTIACTSGTASEYPIVIDVNNDGSAEIIIGGNGSGTGDLFVYGSDPDYDRWAPARKVWNQFAYNAVNINEDLTVPKTMLNPATAFFGGTCQGGDTIYPYNGYLMQQTALNKFGCPIFLLPDVSPSNPATAPYSGTSLIVNVDVTNTGDAAIIPPVYIAIYKNSISAANLLGVGSLNAPILAGATATVSDTIANISSKFPIANLIVRVNDNGTTYPYQTECNYSNEITVPYVGANNRKDARLNLEVTIQNGTLGNPVAVLYTDEIKYEITAVNASLSSNTVVIRDTLPLYTDYVAGSAVPVPDGGGVTSTLTLPAQQVLTWTFPSVSSMATQTVEYKTTPESGACAAQPLFVNTAWVQFGAQQLPTNSTYHQGAGVAIVTFSALAHGEIYNDEMQAVDFNTAARSGVLVVPDEGYAFVGWSHEEYISLKGEIVPSQSGIMEYDTLTVYGNVELQANFVRKDEVANENVSDAVIDAQDRASQNKVWSSGQNLYVQVKESGCVIRIYNTEGTLIRQLATVSDGTTTIDNLSRGIYIVTVNGQAGNKVRIE